MSNAAYRDRLGTWWIDWGRYAAAPRWWHPIDLILVGRAIALRRPRRDTW